MAKRVFDLVFTIPGIVVLAPVFVIIAILIKYDSSGSVGSAAGSLKITPESSVVMRPYSPGVPSSSAI